MGATPLYLPPELSFVTDWAQGAKTPILRSYGSACRCGFSGACLGPDFLAKVGPIRAAEQAGCEFASQRHTSGRARYVDQRGGGFHA